MNFNIMIVRKIKKCNGLAIFALVFSLFFTQSLLAQPIVKKDKKMMERNVERVSSGMDNTVSGKDASLGELDAEETKCEACNAAKRVAGKDISANKKEVDASGSSSTGF